MKNHSNSLSGGAVVAVLALSISACGGGGSDSGDVSPAFDVGYNSADDLTGRTRVRYVRGGSSWATEFIYTSSADLGGVRYAQGDGIHATSALSTGISFDDFACAEWDDLAASASVSVGDLGETYLCNWAYTSGARNWYAMSIEDDGVVSGRNIFISSGSALNGIAELVAGRGSILVGEHEPNYSRSFTGKKANAYGMEKVYEDLEAAVSQ